MSKLCVYYKNVANQVGVFSPLYTLEALRTWVDESQRQMKYFQSKVRDKLQEEKQESEDKLSNMIRAVRNGTGSKAERGQ
jgi:hypothetical protein